MDPESAAHLALPESTSPFTVSVCAFALEHKGFADFAPQRVGVLRNQLERCTAPELIRAPFRVTQRAVDGGRRRLCKTRATTRNVRNVVVLTSPGLQLLDTVLYLHSTVL